MRNLPIPLRAMVLAALVSTAAHAVSIPAIFERQATCAAGKVSCPAGVPGSFCCQTGLVCIALAGNTTALCCPRAQQSECKVIEPIGCDVGLMDPAQHPDSNVKTTALNSKLPTCGSEKCCPFGFSCDNSSGTARCVMDEDQTKVPAGAPRPSSSVSAPPSTSTPAPTTTTASPSSPAATTSTSGGVVATEAPVTGPAQPEPQDGSGQAFPTTAVVVGTVVGVLGGAALTGALLFFCFRRRKQQRNGRISGRSLFGRHSGGGENKIHHRPTTSTSSFGNIISDPIMHDNGAFRTDFILKTPTTQGDRSAQSSPTRPAAAQTRGSPPSARAGAGAGRLSGMFRTSRASDAGNSPATYAPPTGVPMGTVGGAAVPPIRAMRNSTNGGYKYGSAPQPVTPRLQREPSSESINVFADPSTVGRSASDRNRRNTQATTFTDLMEEADLGGVMNHGYVPQSAQNTPRRPR